jgi:hypothetical protein
MNKNKTYIHTYICMYVEVRYFAPEAREAEI